MGHGHPTMTQSPFVKQFFTFSQIPDEIYDPENLVLLKLLEARGARLTSPTKPQIVFGPQFGTWWPLLTNGGPIVTVGLATGIYGDGSLGRGHLTLFQYLTETLEQFVTSSVRCDEAPPPRDVSPLRVSPGPRPSVPTSRVESSRPTPSRELIYLGTTVSGDSGLAYKSSAAADRTPMSQVIDTIRTAPRGADVYIDSSVASGPGGVAYVGEMSDDARASIVEYMAKMAALRRGRQYWSQSHFKCQTIAHSHKYFVQKYLCH